MKQCCIGLLFFLSTAILGASSEFSYTLDHVNTSKKVLALTFDDGPHPKNTRLILDLLDQYNAKATFFLTGYNAKLYPDLVLEIYKRGHEIGNHSYMHEAYSQLEKEDVLIDLARSQKLFHSITGEYPAYFRPPFGRLNEDQIPLLKHFFSDIVGWNLDPKDWEKHTKSGDILIHIYKHYKPGSIVLLHSYSDQTVKMLPSLLETYHNQGIIFATITSLQSYDNFQEDL